MAAVTCHNLTKTYGRGPQAETALRGVTLAFAPAESYVLLGPSGSGKTTLLSILGCLLTPSTGTVEIDGSPVNFRSQARLCALRRTKIGFVFQHAQLLPFLSVRENLIVVAKNAGVDRRSAEWRLGELLERLGIAEYAQRKPPELSGGQRQRVAIARALLHRPSILLADEPTASLDWENGEAAITLLIEQAKTDGASLIAVTHDTRLIGHFDRVIHLDSGQVSAA